MSEYELQKNGAVLEIDLKNGEVKKFCCCDCNLVHLFIFEKAPNDKLHLTVYRNDFETDILRRASKKKKPSKKAKA